MHSAVERAGGRGGSGLFAGNTKAAKRFLTRLLTQHGMGPKRMVTDKLRSYGAAKRQVMPNVEHWSYKGLNNRAENSHLRCESGSE